MHQSIETVELAKNHYGQSVALDIHHYDSGLDGPHVFIQSSVHGAELQGNLVIDELVNLLKEQEWQGKVSVAPFANPWSAHAHFGAGTYGRFDAMSGRNWNRAYHDLSDSELFTKFLSNHSPEDANFFEQFKILLAEQLESINVSRQNYGFQRGHKLTYELQKRSSQADIVLDLHTAQVADLYLYAPVYLQERVRDLHFPVNLIIPDSFDGAGDEGNFAPWCHLKKIANDMGMDFDIPVEAYTIELGGEEFVDGDLAAKQAQYLAYYLYKRGLFKQNHCALTFSDSWYQTLDHYQTYYADCACLCDYQVKPGAYVNAGDTLANLRFTNESGETTLKPLKALEEGIVVNHASTSNLQAGSEVFQILEKPQKYPD